MNRRAGDAAEYVIEAAEVTGADADLVAVVEDAATNPVDVIALPSNLDAEQIASTSSTDGASSTTVAVASSGVRRRRAGVHP